MTRGGKFGGAERTAIPHNFMLTSPINQNLNYTKYPYAEVGV
jgi:hypothetical protein